jgi:hypothetical protein
VVVVVEVAREITVVGTMTVTKRVTSEGVQTGADVLLNVNAETVAHGKIEAKRLKRVSSMMIGMSE